MTTPAPIRPTTTRWARLLTVGCAATLTLLTACSSTDALNAPPAQVIDSVGTIAGSNALVALVVQGDEIGAYVCDGPGALGERFHGTLAGEQAELRSERGAVLTVTLGAGTATGTFTPAGGGTPQTFSTTPSQGDAGMYLADGPAGDFSAGWIVLADGTQTGVVRSGGTKSRAPELTIDGQRTKDRSRPGSGRETERLDGRQADEGIRTRTPRAEELTRSLEPQAELTRVSEPQAEVPRTRQPQAEVPRTRQPQIEVPRTRVPQADDVPRTADIDPSRPGGDGGGEDTPPRLEVPIPDRPDLDGPINTGTRPEADLPGGIGLVEPDRIDPSDLPDRDVNLGQRGGLSS